MSHFRPYWSGRRVLLTGHTGFKGSWRALWLSTVGAEVVGFSDGVPTDPSMFEAASVSNLADSVEGDVRDLNGLAAALAASAPSVVFHLAAQSLVRESHKDPVRTAETNVLGTLNLLESVRCAESPIEVVVIVTTDKCYENRGWEYGYRETDRLGGKDLYSASKSAAEIITRAYRESFFSQPESPCVVTVRAGNVIGGGDYSADRLIPDIVRASGTADSTVVLRNPTAERPWQHVLDCLSGYLLLAQRLSEDRQFTGAWNFGPQIQPKATVEDVVERFLGQFGRAVRVAVHRDESRAEEHLLAVDSSRAFRRLGWTPRLDLNEAVRLTAEWYDAHLRGEDMQRLTLEQIRVFEEMDLGH